MLFGGGSIHGDGEWVVGGAQAVVLALADVVIEEEVDLLGWGGKRGEETGGSLQVSLVGIDASYKGDAYPVWYGGLTDDVQIGKDGLIIDACILLVKGRVHVLEVDKDEVAMGEDALQGTGRTVEGGVEGGMDALSLQLAKEAERGLGLHEGFAATQGDATTRGLDGKTFLLDLAENLVEGPITTGRLEGKGRAGVATSVAMQAVCVIGLNALLG